MVDSGPGVFEKTFGSDHTLRGNVFVLKNKRQPAVPSIFDRRREHGQ